MKKNSTRHKVIARYVTMGLFFMLLLVTSSAEAISFRTGDEVVIAEGEIIDDDLYFGGNRLTLNGTVRGDVIASGRFISINGKVEGDVMAAGQVVTINGEVADDIRITGAALSLGTSALIGDDVVAAGYSLETRAGSRVEGSLTFGGGQILLAGNVAEDVNAGAGAMQVEGSIGGNLQAKVGETGPGFDINSLMPGLPELPNLASGLTVGDNARIEGDLEVSTIKDVEVGNAVGGEVTLDKRDTSPVARTRSRAWTGFQRYLALVVVGLFLLWLVPNWVKRPADRLEAHPWQSLGLGGLTFLAVPLVMAILIGVVLLVVVFLASLTLGNLGAALGLIGGSTLLTLGIVFLLIVGYLAQVIVAYTGGNAIMRRYAPDSDVQPVYALLLGSLIVVFLSALPFIGFIMTMLIALFGLGALWWRRHEGRQPQGRLSRTAA